jgi:hypothetical protein
MESTVDDEIMLESGEVDLRPVESQLRKITSELSQYNKKTNTKRFFRIYDNQILGVGEKSANKQHSYLLHLAMLARRPTRSLNIRRGLLLAAFFFALVSCVLIATKIYGIELAEPLYIYGLAILCAGLSLYCFYMLVKSIRTSLVFKSAHGHVPVVEFYSKLPDKKQLRRFISAMKKNISTLRKDKKYSSQGAFSAELNEHRILREKGILTARQYESAKKNIMGKHK